MSISKRSASGHRFLHGVCIMCGQSEKMYDLKCAPVPSKVVASYIRFDHQQHLHSWHDLQDCLEELRKIEEKQAEDSRKLSAVREQLQPLIPILRQMQSSGFTPHELQEINAAELLAIIDQPRGEA